MIDVRKYASVFGLFAKSSFAKILLTITAMAAAQILNLTDTGGAKRKAVIDALSAEIILQNYLDSERSLS